MKFLRIIQDSLSSYVTKPHIMNTFMVAVYLSMPTKLSKFYLRPKLIN